MYAYSFNEEEFNSEECTTAKEALQLAKEEAIDQGEQLPCRVWVGEIGTFNPMVDADDVLERLQEKACEECGECSDGYLDDASEKERDELSKMLTATFHKWEKKYHFEPRFHPIENVQEFEIRE